MKNLFQNRAVGFWLDLAGTVLTLVGIILYALYAADTGSNNVWVYIGLVAAVAAGAAGLVTDNDLLAIAAPALSAVSLCAFITDGGRRRHDDCCFRRRIQRGADRVCASMR